MEACHHWHGEAVREPHGVIHERTMRKAKSPMEAVIVILPGPRVASCRFKNSQAAGMTALVREGPKKKKEHRATPPPPPSTTGISAPCPILVLRLPSPAAHVGGSLSEGSQVQGPFIGTAVPPFPVWPRRAPPCPISPISSGYNWRRSISHSCIIFFAPCWPIHLPVPVNVGSDHVAANYHAPAPIDRADTYVGRDYSRQL